MTSYTIRLSDESDPTTELDRIIRFYAENTDPGNRARDPIDLLKSVENKQAYILEDEEYNIVGVALCFPHTDMYTEAGGTRILKNGFGLQKILHICRAVNEYFFRPPEIAYFCIIAAWNKLSIHNTSSVGFIPWNPDSSVLEAIGVDVRTYDISKKIFYTLNKSILKDHAQYLIKIYNDPIIYSRDGSEMINLNFDIPLLKVHEIRAIVELIALGRVPLPFLSRT